MWDYRYLSWMEWKEAFELKYKTPLYHLKRKASDHIKEEAKKRAIGRIEAMDDEEESDPSEDEEDEETYPHNEESITKIAD